MSRRAPVRAVISDSRSADEALAHAREAFRSGDPLEAIDLYEQLVELQPDHAVELLAELYDHYRELPADRYSLYVARDFDFRIGPGDRVLDIGSGHKPFPFATHLADCAPDDDAYGRNGAPLRQVEGKPFFECSVESMPFEDREFDFAYCSHVLEHVVDPARACEELMRVARRGYIETPTRGKDLWLASGEPSNHRWAVESWRDTLIFSEYGPDDRGGLGCDILMKMHCSPQTDREKAFAALVWLKSRLVNTTLYWEDRFEYEVRR